MMRFTRRHRPLSTLFGLSAIALLALAGAASATDVAELGSLDFPNSGAE
jgi:hypothetical protein